MTATMAHAVTCHTSLNVAELFIPIEGLPDVDTVLLVMGVPRPAPMVSTFNLLVGRPPDLETFIFA